MKIDYAPSFQLELNAWDWNISPEVAKPEQAAAELTRVASEAIGVAWKAFRADESIDDCHGKAWRHFEGGLNRMEDLAVTDTDPSEAFDRLLVGLFTRAARGLVETRDLFREDKVVVDPDENLDDERDAGIHP